MDGFKTRTDVKHKRVFRQDKVANIPSINNRFFFESWLKNNKTSLSYLVNGDTTLIPTSYVDDVFLDTHHELSDEILDYDTCNIVWMSGDPNVVCRPKTNECFSRNRVIDLPTGKLLGRIDTAYPCYSDTTYRAQLALNGSTTQTTAVNIPMDYIDTVVCDDPAGSVFMHWRGKNESDQHSVMLYIKDNSLKFHDWKRLGSRTMEGGNIGYCTQIQKPLSADLSNKGTCIWLTHGEGVNSALVHSTQKFRTRILRNTNNTSMGYDRSYGDYGQTKDGATSSYPSHLVPCVDAAGNVIYVLRSYRPYTSAPNVTTELLMHAERPNPIAETLKLEMSPGSTDNSLDQNNYFAFHHVWPHSRQDRDAANKRAFLYTHGITSRRRNIESRPQTSGAYPELLWNHTSTSYSYSFYMYNDRYRLIGIYTDPSTGAVNPIFAFNTAIKGSKNGPKTFVGIFHDPSSSPGRWEDLFKQNSEDALFVCEVPFDPVLAVQSEDGLLIYRPLTTVSNSSVVFISFKSQPSTRVVWAYNQRADAVSISGETYLNAHPYDIRNAKISQDASMNNKYYVDFHNALITPNTKVHVHIRKELNMDYDKIENVGIEPETIEGAGFVRVYLSSSENIRNLTADLEIHL